jgi:hypothetical protein
MAKAKKGYPKARKEHTCQYCWGKIPIGKVYYQESYFDTWEGKWFVYKLHVECEGAFFTALCDMHKVADHWEAWHEENFV